MGIKYKLCLQNTKKDNTDRMIQTDMSGVNLTVLSVQQQRSKDIFHCLNNKHFGVQFVGLTIIICQQCSAQNPHYPRPLG